MAARRKAVFPRKKSVHVIAREVIEEGIIFKTKKETNDPKKAVAVVLTVKDRDKTATRKGFMDPTCGDTLLNRAEECASMGTYRDRGDRKTDPDRTVSFGVGYPPAPAPRRAVPSDGPTN